MFQPRNNPTKILTANRYYGNHLPAATMQAPGVMKVPGEPNGFVDGIKRFDVPPGHMIVYEKGVVIDVLSDEDFTSKYEPYTGNKKDITGEDALEAIKVLKAIQKTDSPIAVQAMLLLRKLGLE